MKITKDDIYFSLNNTDKLTESEKAEINKTMKRNHIKHLHKRKFKKMRSWILSQSIGILALIVAIAAFIKSFF